MAVESARTPPLAPDWILAAIVEVDYSDRIQCQCRGCGHIVFKRIHIVVWADGRIECWGSGCFARELGASRAKVEPLYSGPGGRRLTAEEREWLKSNREQLVAEFREAKALLVRKTAERAAQGNWEADEEPRNQQTRVDAREAEAEDGIMAAAKDVAAAAKLRRGSQIRSRPRSVQASRDSRVEPEPLGDPLYQEIWNRLAAQWRANGIDINRPGQRIMFLQNVRAQYARAQGR